MILTSAPAPGTADQGMSVPPTPGDAMTVIEGNRVLAARTRDLADHAAPGSLARKAAGVASIALSTTKSLAAARQVLDEADLSDDVRERAVGLLGQLTTADSHAIDSHEDR